MIAQRFVEQGQNIRAKQPVVKFQDVDEIDIAVDVPETVMAADIRSADIVQMVAEFSAAPGMQFPVHIKEVAQRADPVTQTFTVRVAMKVPAGRESAAGHDRHRHAHLPARRASWAAGSSCRSPRSFKDSSGAASGLGARRGRDRHAPRRSNSARRRAASIEIVNGLQPGDRIAVAGVTFLREGMKVRDLGDALGERQP